MDIITMHSLFLKCKWEWSRWFSQMHYSVTTCPALGPEPRPRDHEFPNFGRSLHGHHDHTMHLLFYQIYMEVEKKIFLSFKHISIFTLLCKILHNKDWEAGKMLIWAIFFNTFSLHVHIGPFLWPAYWSLPMAWISDPVTIIFTI